MQFENGNAVLEVSAMRLAPSKDAWMKVGLMALISLAIVFAAGAPAHATGLVITPTFGSSITSDPNAASIEGTINSAIAFYETTFSDSVTVNITFNETSSGLGSSSTFFENVPYSQYLAALTADATSANDATALAGLGLGSANPVNSNTTINVKTANLRAVGLPGNVAQDGFINLNTNITDVGSPGTSGQFSLLTTTEHEIDEVLGLGSALPSPRFGTIFPEDLFRYDAAGARSFSANAPIPFTSVCKVGTPTAFLSIDGTTQLAQFNNCTNGGDYGDWQSNPRPSGVPPQVQDAFGTPGADPFLTLGSPEVTALDVIGYTITPAATPEPMTLVLSGTGLAVIAAFKRRKGSRSGATSQPRQTL
jgi:hypothetical protein